MDVFKSFGSEIFGKTMKKAAKTAATKAITTAATKTGEHVGKKAGDKIIKMLSKSNTPKKAAGLKYRSQVRLQVTGHRLQVTGYRSQVTGYGSQTKI